jgi:hypothetical protein
MADAAAFGSGEIEDGSTHGESQTVSALHATPVYEAGAGRVPG